MAEQDRKAGRRLGGRNESGGRVSDKEEEEEDE